MQVRGISLLHRQRNHLGNFIRVHRSAESQGAVTHTPRDTPPRTPALDSPSPVSPTAQCPPQKLGAGFSLRGRCLPCLVHPPVPPPKRKPPKFLPNKLCQRRDQRALGFNHLKGKDKHSSTKRVERVSDEGQSCQRNRAGGQFSHHQHLTIFLYLSFPFIAEEVRERKEQSLGNGRFLPEKALRPSSS